jgi:hypothetical protein
MTMLILLDSSASISSRSTRDAILGRDDVVFGSLATPRPDYLDGLSSSDASIDLGSLAAIGLFILGDVRIILGQNWLSIGLQHER